MASLLTNEQRASFGSNFNDLFDTLWEDIVIYKEPIKNITSINQTPAFGYPGDELPESVTYTPVYGTYKARIFYGNPEEDLIGLYNDERLRINYFWLVGKKELEDKQAELRNKEREH